MVNDRWAPIARGGSNHNRCLRNIIPTTGGGHSPEGPHATPIGTALVTVYHIMSKKQPNHIKASAGRRQPGGVSREASAERR